MTELHLTWILLFALIELGCVALFLGWKRARIARRVGTRSRSVRGSRRMRWALVVAAWLATLALCYGAVEPDDRVDALFSAVLAVLAVASAVAILSPTDLDRDLGSAGVRSGWDAVAFGEFSEWRLSGEHLRFRVEGRLWDAAPIGQGDASKLRERLSALVPERESRYAE